MANIARHAVEVQVSLSKVQVYNEAMKQLQAILVTLGGKMPAGVVLEAKPKYKR
jgi:hypothetical protein